MSDIYNEVRSSNEHINTRGFSRLGRNFVYTITGAPGV